MDNETSSAAPTPSSPDLAADPATRIHGAIDALFVDLHQYLARPALESTARKMGIWRNGHMCLHGDEYNPHLQLFIEYCLLDLATNGKTAIERYRHQTKPAPDSDRGQLLDALAHAPLSVYQITARPSADTAVLRDVSNQEEVSVLEPRMWKDISDKTLVIGRVVTYQGVTCTTGSLMILDMNDEDKSPQVPAAPNAKQARERATAILRPLLKSAADQAHHHDHAHGHSHDHG